MSAICANPDQATRSRHSQSKGRFVVKSQKDAPVNKRYSMMQASKPGTYAHCTKQTCQTTQAAVEECGYDALPPCCAREVTECKAGRKYQDRDQPPRPCITGLLIETLLVDEELTRRDTTFCDGCCSVEKIRLVLELGRRPSASARTNRPRLIGDKRHTKPCQ